MLTLVGLKDCVPKKLIRQAGPCVVVSGKAGTFENEGSFLLKSDLNIS